MAAINAIAGGTIGTAVFVKVSTAADNTVLQCSSGDRPIGISTPSQKLAPIPNASSYAAASGDPVTIFGLGDICNLVAGSGGFTRGDLLKPEASTGFGLPVGSSGDIFGAIALESAAYQTLGRVIVAYGHKP